MLFFPYGCVSLSQKLYLRNVSAQKADQVRIYSTFYAYGTVTYQKLINFIVPYPTVMIIAYAISELGTPLIMNVLTVRYGLLNSLVMQMAVTLGNPDVGNPMAAEQSKALTIMSNLGRPSLMLTLISEMRGTTIRAATVWLTNVAMTRIRSPNVTVTPNKE